jgi:hypothetical protein
VPVQHEMSQDHPPIGSRHNVICVRHRRLLQY